MNIKKKKYECENCKFQPNQWLGRCPECGEWNTFVEVNLEVAVNVRSLSLLGQNQSQRIDKIKIKENSRLISSIDEFDRVVGGGLAVGSLCLLGGEPGIGKSTLMLELINSYSQKYKSSKLLYITAEESLSQVALRSKRLKLKNSNVLVFNEFDWGKIQIEIEKLHPLFIIIDSIQMITSTDVSSFAGSVNQIKEITYELMNMIKGSSSTCIVIGHLTKEGTIAGPKVLEHMVDTVLHFEKSDEPEVRVLRSIKNRFGSTQEIGLFEMRPQGLGEVNKLTLSQKVTNNDCSSGVVHSCYSEGSRNFYCEIQALVTDNNLTYGQRTTNGISKSRLLLLIAIIEKHLSFNLSHKDIYLNIVGKLKATDRIIDLSIVAAILSSHLKIQVDRKSLFLGEVDLTGTIRSKVREQYNDNELQALGYTKLIVPKGLIDKKVAKVSTKVDIIKNIKELVEKYIK